MSVKLHKDLDDFELIFKKNYSNLVLYTFKLLGDYNESEDVVQDVFFSYWKKKDELELSGSLESYLFGAVRNQCQNKIRHLSVIRSFKTQHAFEDRLAENPYNTLVGSEMEATIKKTLNNLPELTREIFKKNRFESKKYKEIAQELQISIKTVEAHMGKVLKAMRVNLNHHITALIIILFGL